MKRYSEKQVVSAIKRALQYADDQRNSATAIRETLGNFGAATSAHWTAYGVEIGLEQLFYELTKKDSYLANGNRIIPYAHQAKESE